jgi:hypothetical protein
MAYAAEMADMEDRRCISWAMTWESIRERAQMVLGRHLNDDEGEAGIPISKLTVEIDIEDLDGRDFLDHFSDTD